MITCCLFKCNERVGAVTATPAPTLEDRQAHIAAKLAERKAALDLSISD